MKKNLASVLIAITISGCSLGTGQNDFNCSAGDGNALCAPTSSIYELTNGTITMNDTVVVVEDGEKKAYTVVELKKMNGQHSEISEINSTDAQSINVPQRFSYDGNVLRNDIEVLRVWIAPFIDTNDDLHLSTMVYTDITKKSWTLGSQSQDETHQFTRNKSAVENELIPKDDHVYRPPSKEQEILKARSNLNMFNGAISNERNK